jgi:hypothetical protein
VPEVWRFDGQALTFHLLGPSGQYAVVSHSHSFPMLTAADVLRFLKLRGQTDEVTLFEQFRAWLRQQAPGGTPSPPAPQPADPPLSPPTNPPPPPEQQQGVHCFFSDRPARRCYNWRTFRYRCSPVPARNQVLPLRVVRC